MLAAFSAAEIPFTIVEAESDRTIRWPKSYDTKVAAISEELFGKAPPAGRSYSFIDETLYAKLQTDLKERGIDSYVYRHRGPYGEYSYIYWDEAYTSEVVPVIESYGHPWFSEEERKQFFGGGA
ncbi:MAG: hypothetical protein ACFHX7_15725 [Pseudomonadota bacterium]